MQRALASLNVAPFSVAPARHLILDAAPRPPPPVMGAVDRFLVRWARHPDGGGPGHARRLVRMLVGMLLVMVVGAIGAHVSGLVAGAPPAGRNTRVVPEMWGRLPARGTLSP